MAQKKPPKRSWLKALLFYIVLPLVIWIVAFVAWLYWDDMAKLFSKEQAREHKPRRGSDKFGDNQKVDGPAKNSREIILDDDRKRLEDILKQRQ